MHRLRDNKIEAITVNTPFPLHRIKCNITALRGLHRKFVQYSYDEETICRLLEIQNPWQFDYDKRPIWMRYVYDKDNSTHLLISLFFLGIPQRRKLLLKCLDRDELSFLQESHLISIDSRGMCRPNVSLFPFNGLIVATDGQFGMSSSLAKKAVMPLGLDSYSLARQVILSSGEDALDLCTGSGIAALAASKKHTRATGIDVNPRAINFARFNALFNGIDNCEFLVSNLFEVVGHNKYDLISANPPFVPTPNLDRVLYRDGGSSGEKILRKIISHALRYLNDRGQCLITTDIVQHRGIPFEKKLKMWINKKKGFSAVIFKGSDRDIYTYAQAHNANYSPYRPRPKQNLLLAWIDHYLRQNIESISFGIIGIRRNVAGTAQIRTVNINDLGLYNHNNVMDFTHVAFDQLNLFEEKAFDTMPLRAAFDFGTQLLIPNNPVYEGFRVTPQLAVILSDLYEKTFTARQIITHLQRTQRLDDDRISFLKTLLQDLYLTGHFRKSEDS